MTNNSAMDTLKNLLGDNADEKIQAVMSSLAGSSSQNDDNISAPSLPVPSKEPPKNLLNDNSLEYIMRIKGIIDELGSSNNDYRSNLLLSLKPFMRDGRQQSIDSAVRLLNLTKLTSLFKH